MAFADAITLLLTLSLLSLAACQIQTPPPESSSPPPPPSEALLNAVETLSNSGYGAMSLTLKLILDQPKVFTLPPSLTIFAPSDSAFMNYGHPSLTRLLLHFSPLSLSSESLTSLPVATAIPTLSRTPAPLFVTSLSSDPGGTSINRVNVSEASLYDDGAVVIFGVDGFFEVNFTLPASEESSSRVDIQCVKFTSFSNFTEPSGILKSRGYSLMATFLDLQLMGFVGSGVEMKLTLFAPTDDALSEDFGNILEYRSIFLRHLLPCKCTWVQLMGSANETVYTNYVEGLSMKITKGDGTVMVNGVQIMAPDIFENDYIAIHGVRELIPAFDAAKEYEFDEISMVKFMKKVEHNSLALIVVNSEVFFHL